MAMCSKAVGVAIVGLSVGCTPARLPPTTSIVDVAQQRHEQPVDELEVADANTERVDLDLTRRSPDRESLISPADPLQPRVVTRGGQEVWIGEPDRVVQDWVDNYGYRPPSACPLAISFDSAPVELRPTPAHAFDLGGTTACEETDWPSAATPWLVLDRDDSGSIDDGSELFGTGTRLPGGELARDGFAALAALDANADGRITADDPQWSSLRLWADDDADRRSDPSELQSLDDAGILALDLAYEAAPRCDDRGNCEIERAPMLWRSASDQAPRRGALVDVHLRCR